MTDYSSLTVAQLKEILKARGLAVDGKKADLIKRLTDADETAPADVETETTISETAPQELDAAAPKTVEAPIVEKEEESAPSADTNDTLAEENGDLTPSEAPVAEEKPKPKVLTPEERKQLAVELLNKKIHRAEKFGDEKLAQEAKKDLARVEKFGVELGTGLAREIGAVDRSLGDGKRRGFKKNFNKNKNRNRNKNGKARA